MPPYFKAAKVYQKDEHGQLLLENNKPVQAVLYHWRHTLVYEHLKAGMPVYQIAMLIGDTTDTLMQHYAHFIHELQPELDKASESSWNLAELATF